MPADQRQAPPVGGADDEIPNATYLERVFEAGGGTVGGYNNFWIAPGSRVVTVRRRKAELDHHRSAERSGAADEAGGARVVTPNTARRAVAPDAG